jgi:hypothetical protein
MRPTRLILPALALACAVDDDAGCPDGRCDERAVLDDRDVPASPCDGVLVDRSGRRNPDGSTIRRVAGRLGDPLATLVYRTPGGCPTSFADVAAKLAQVDATGCADPAVTTHLVSEGAGLEGTAAGQTFRAVTARACGGRPPSHLLFSQLDLDPGGAGFPDGVEIAAFDERTGVFNFYKEVDGAMAFFGDSLDFVTLGPATPGATGVRGCANCHTGGGLIMKELEAPWLHWSGGDFDVPGGDDVLAQRPALGTLANAPDLETIVRDGNAGWNATRLDHLRRQGTVAELLRPLFCPVELEIGSGFSGMVPSGLIGDRTLSETIVPLASFGDGGSSGLDAEAGYQALIAAIGQFVAGHPGKRDTAGQWTHFARSAADRGYVEALIDAGVVYRALVDEVQTVDITPPVFSDERCDLLAFAPDLPPDARTAATIRAGFVARLRAGAPGPAGRQLLAFLARRDPKKPVAHAIATKGFEHACRARTDTRTIGAVEVAGIAVDATKLRSLQRKVVAAGDGVLDDVRGSAGHPRPILEFPDTMAADRIRVVRGAAPGALDEVDPGARLSPLTCELVAEFVPVTPVEVAPHGGCVRDDREGLCVDTTQVTCPTELVTGECPGAAAIQCCLLEDIRD